MFLHGWKEIATYLHCGVRTVQRWEALGMPVSRIRVGDRGPVMAQTDDLDAWINQQSGKSKGRLRPDIEANVSRAASARASAMKELKILLQNELSVGLSLAQTALRNNNEKRSERNTAMARQAYDAIIRLSLRLKLSELPSAQFERDLTRLKVILRQLGEKL